MFNSLYYNLYSKLFRGNMYYFHKYYKYFNPELHKILNMYNIEYYESEIDEYVSTFNYKPIKFKNEKSYKLFIDNNGYNIRDLHLIEIFKKYIKDILKNGLYIKKYKWIKIYSAKSLASIGKTQFRFVTFPLNDDANYFIPNIKDLTINDSIYDYCKIEHLFTIFQKLEANIIFIDICDLDNKYYRLINNNFYNMIILFDDYMKNNKKHINSITGEELIIELDYYQSNTQGKRAIGKIFEYNTITKEYCFNG